MKRVASGFLVFSGLLLVGHWMTPVRAQQTGTQLSTSPQDAQSLTPPPAYAPLPKGVLPAEDTPAERDALAKWKARAEQRTEADRKTYNAQVTSSYNFHYGPKNPFTPGNVQVQGEGFLQPGAFPTAEYCGTCHQEAYSQWRQALHSNAFRTPFYRTSVNILIRDKTRGIAFARHCDSCHNPDRSAGRGADRRLEGRSRKVRLRRADVHHLPLCCGSGLYQRKRQRQDGRARGNRGRERGAHSWRGPLLHDSPSP